jgi:hypothetical protein
VAITLDSTEKMAAEFPMDNFVHNYGVAIRVLIARRKGETVIADRAVAQITDYQMYIAALYVITDLMAIALDHEMDGGAVALLEGMRNNPPYPSPDIP